MLKFLRKKSDVQKLIDRAGLEGASFHYAGIVAGKIPNHRILKQFLLEELDGASQGNEFAQEFARDSPIPAHEYKGALRCSFPEVDGPNGPQQTLHRITLQLSSNRDLMAKFRIMIVSNIAQRMRVGTPDTPSDLNTTKKMVNYERMFSSATETHQHIYGERSKTAEIFGSEEFIKAWLNSGSVNNVTAVIRSEALNGDIASIKQMIWVYNLYFRDVGNLPLDKDQQTELKKKYLKERIIFCEKAIALGLKDKSYAAMVSSANLYSILMSDKTVTEENTRNALNGIVKYAKLFIESGNDDPEMIGDAENLLEQYAGIALVTNAFNQ